MASHPPRVVVLAYFFPPMSTIGSHRPLRLCRYLREQGVEVTVYAGHPEFAPITEKPDPSLNALIPEGVEVRRIPSFHPVQWLIDARDRLRGRTAPAAKAKAADAPQGHGGGGNGSASGLKAALEGLLSRFAFPDRYSGWIAASLPLLLADLAVRKADALFVTGPPWSPMVLAHLAGRLTGTPVCLDYRDPWNLNPYHKGESDPARLALERRILEGSRAVLTNTRGMAECYAEAFPDLADRIRAVYNGIDAGTLAEMAALRASRKERGDGVLRVSHIGTLYRNRMPAALARMLAHAAAEWRGERDIRFRFIGGLEDPEVLKSAFAERGCLHKLETPGQVGAATARREQVEADVLLLLQSGTSLQIPAKVFEYALTGRPLVCFADAGSETGGLIESYGLGTVLRGDEEPSVLLEALRGMQEGRGEAESFRRFLADFDGPALSARMAEAILGAPTARTRGADALPPS